MGSFAGALLVGPISHIGLVGPRATYPARVPFAVVDKSVAVARIDVGGCFVEFLVVLFLDFVDNMLGFDRKWESSVVVVAVHMVFNHSGSCEDGGGFMQVVIVPERLLA